MRWLALLLVLLPVEALAAAACTSPDSWPLGDQVIQFPISNGNFVTSTGWDPAFVVGYDDEKDTLTTGISTYHVGLPVGTDAETLPHWPGEGNMTAASLATADANDWATIIPGGLTGVTGTVYLIEGYRFESVSVDLSPGVNVAFWGSSFLSDVSADTGATGHFFFVDSFFNRPLETRQGECTDADGNIVAPPCPQRGFLTGGQVNTGTPSAADTFSTDSIKWHVLYSEVVGGGDAAKAHNVGAYRNHLHGVEKIGDFHTDGMQINSSSGGTFLFENNVEVTYRHTNAALFLQNSHSDGIHDTFVVNNLLSGGGVVMSTCGKDGSKPNRHGPCIDSAICGNRVLGDNGNVSWASPSNDLSGPPFSLNGGTLISGSHYRELNRFYSGASGVQTSITDNEGGAHSLTSTPSLPTALKTQIDTYVALHETWASEIRTAAGVATGRIVTPVQVTPTTPTIADDMFVTWGTSGFGALTDCDVDWTGADSGTQDVNTPFTSATIAETAFTTNGETCFTVTCTDGTPGSSAEVCRTFAAAAQTLVVTITPTGVSGAAPLSQEICVTAVSGTQTGTLRMRLDETNDGTWDETETGYAVGSLPFCFAGDAGPYTVDGYLQVGVTRGSNTEQTYIIEVDVTSAAALHEIIHPGGVRIFDATKPDGEQDTGVQLSDGLIIDRDEIGSAPNPCTFTNAFDLYGSVYTGASSLDVTITEPDSTVALRTENSMPYCRLGELGWSAVDDQIPFAAINQTDVSLSVDGVYRYVGTAYDQTGGAAGTGDAGTTRTYDFTIGDLTNLAVTPAQPTTAEAFVISYDESGYNATTCLADCNGDGTFGDSVDETLETASCSAQAQGTRDVGISCESGEISGTLALTITSAGGATVSPLPLRLAP